MAEGFAKTRGDKVFIFVNTSILILITAMVLYPLILVVSSSFSNPLQVMSGNVWLFPKEFTIQSYQMVFQDSSILIGYRNTLLYTVVGTLINLTMTIAAAYPLSRRDFVGRNLITAMFVFTMFFSGGLIPTYLVVKGLGLVDTFWVMVLPNAVAMYNIIIMRTYMQTSIPPELHEAAYVDGSTNIGVLWRIVLPLSKPILAVMVLFYGVAHWNAFFNALIYLSDRSHFPLQLILREILIQNQLSAQIMADVDSLSDRQMFAEGIKYAVIIVASVPVLIIYPFLQRYFVKGFMVGALKG
ncbi:sugar ABC transporter permease [Paenibacillus sp. FSL H8-0548]|uniref:carbohydrate ABC transporter permease n=1 Tax=Paenibacillus sp. FSL H8-0548 TaxID=1920422 RepID=UPI00096E4B98|nr:carbohydrate ABC transporter permease [Paenibacillus sp. FSL H8-0548]OMF38657.1 sugar ABC transporter permease [Paenibacillus sp. FSL H8-0548]